MLPCLLLNRCLMDKYETGQVIAGARTVFAWRIILRDGKSSIQPITGTSQGRPLAKQQ